MISDNKNQVAYAWRENNKDKVKETNKKSYLKHRDKRIEYCRQYRIKNIEKSRERDRINNKKRYALKRDESLMKSKEWREKNKDHLRDYFCRFKYKIGMNEKRDMYESQDGKCAICKEPHPFTGPKGLQIDHCHVTGAVRGLLCGLCNRVLAFAKDNTGTLDGAIRYLNKAIPQSEVA